MKRIVTALILLAAFFCLAGYGPALAADTIEVNQQGRTVTVKMNPQRVVILDFSALDTVHELGLGEYVVALPHKGLPDFLSQYADTKYANIGDVKDFDYEKIKKVNPDLILISGRQEPMYDELAKLAPVVNTGIMSEEYMQDFRANTRLLGRLWGKEAEAEKLLKDIEDDIAVLHKQGSADPGRGLIVLYNNGKFSAYGKGSRFGVIHEAFAIKPVDENLKVSNHGHSISSEYILQTNPDYLFVVDRNVIITGKASNTAEIENKIIQKTNAYKNGKIIYLSPAQWYLANGGVGAMRHMIKEVSAGLAQ